MPFQYKETILFIFNVMSVAAFVFSIVRADTSLKWECKCRIQILSLKMWCIHRTLIHQADSQISLCNPLCQRSLHFSLHFPQELCFWGHMTQMSIKQLLQVGEEVPAICKIPAGGGKWSELMKLKCSQETTLALCCKGRWNRLKSLILFFT